MLPGNHELGLRIGSFDAALGDPAAPTPDNSSYRWAGVAEAPAVFAIFCG